MTFLSYLDPEGPGSTFLLNRFLNFGLSPGFYKGFSSYSFTVFFLNGSSINFLFLFGDS